MLSKKHGETELKDLFRPFGTVEDVVVLRDQTGNPRGCAFVTFTTKSSAYNAIKTLHLQKTLEVRAMDLPSMQGLYAV